MMRFHGQNKSSVPGSIEDRAYTPRIPLSVAVTLIRESTRPPWSFIHDTSFANPSSSLPLPPVGDAEAEAPIRVHDVMTVMILMMNPMRRCNEWRSCVVM